MGIGVCDHRALTTSYERVSMKLVEQEKAWKKKGSGGENGFFFLRVERPLRDGR